MKTLSIISICLYTIRLCLCRDCSLLSEKCHHLGSECCPGLTCILWIGNRLGVCLKKIESFSASSIECSIERQRCGGKSGIQCCDALTCLYLTQTLVPNYPDEIGTCSRCNTKGGICGSGHQCCGQLNCQYDDDNQGANGTCVEPVCGPIGTPCGGRYGIQCCQGLNCLKSERRPNYYHDYNHYNQGGPINKICKKRNPLEEKPWNWLG